MSRPTFTFIAKSCGIWQAVITVIAAGMFLVTDAGLRATLAVYGVVSFYNVLAFFMVLLLAMMFEIDVDDE